MNSWSPVSPHPPLLNLLQQLRKSPSSSPPQLININIKVNNANATIKVYKDRTSISDNKLFPISVISEEKKPLQTPLTPCSPRLAGTSCGTSSHL